MQIKVCITCEKEKDVREFQEHRNHISGIYHYHPECNECYEKKQLDLLMEKFAIKNEKPTY